MALPGELKGLQKELTCECGEKMPLQVCRSAAGYYIGFFCGECGPHSRETSYYPKGDDAQKDLDAFMKDGIEPSTQR